MMCLCDIGEMCSQVFLLEFTCTFVLVYVVFATAVDKAGSAKVASFSKP